MTTEEVEALQTMVRDLRRKNLALQETISELDRKNRNLLLVRDNLISEISMLEKAFRRKRPPPGGPPKEIQLP